ncbi:MAG: DUF4199 family protein [Bacteroidetes bacterium]|nr:DUF4199 family protein [Bacteroidota bacterium]
MNKIIRNGVIGGLAVMVLFAAAYFINPKNIQSGFLLFISNFMMFGVAMFTALQVRKQNGGILNYNDSLGYIFITYLVALVAYNVLNFIFIASYPAIQNDLIAFRKSTITDAVQLKEFEANLTKTGIMRMIFFQWVFNILIFAVLGLLISLILTIFVRKEPQE